MTGQGSFNRIPNRTLNLMMSMHLFWFLIVTLLGAWWGRLVLSYSKRVSELEVHLGLPVLSPTHYEKTQRMLLWEGATFFGLIVASSAFLFWIYRRDAKRTRSLSAFFASLTHELRTPLTSIRLQAESLAVDSPQHDLTQRLLEDTLRLESQVDRTLELARVEGGGPVFTQTLRLQQWLKRSLETWADSYGNHIQVRVELEERMIQADVGALQVILRNLLENSIRHSGKDPVQVTFSLGSANKGFVNLCYQDYGQGYPGDPKNLGKLFFKGSKSHGAGVGLYLIHALMERMGGQAKFGNHGGFQAQLIFVEGNTNG